MDSFKAVLQDSVRNDQQINQDSLSRWQDDSQALSAKDLAGYQELGRA